MVVLEFRLPDFKGIHLMIKLSCLPALKCSRIIYTFLCSTPKRPPRAHTIRLFSLYQIHTARPMVYSSHILCNMGTIETYFNYCEHPLSDIVQCKR